MRLYRIDPPGTWLQTEAVFDLLKKHRAGESFLEIGCGDGRLSQRLLARGFRGVGLDLSDEALAIAQETLKPSIESGRYSLQRGDVVDVQRDSSFDFAVSMMVVEHVEEDVRFVRSIADRVQPGGIVVIGVPGRKDHWSIEDETVGHLRRYEKEELRALLANAGLEVLDVWSVAVPVANVLFRFGNRLIARSEVERAKIDLAQSEQTGSSGVREIPFKTVFPAPFRLVLNRWTMMPFAILQRMFYRSRLGITLLACGRVPAR